MIVAAAVDIRKGRCVQLVGGDPDVQRISLPSPLEAARSWIGRGFRHLHVVDLDAAFAEGDNNAVVDSLLPLCDDVQVGGGVRDDRRAGALLRAGAARIIVGTRALSDPTWLETLAGAHPGRVVAAADVRDGTVVVQGWTRESGQALEDVLQRWQDLPLAGVLVTDVSREGRLEGLDTERVAQAREATRHSLWVAGGIGSLTDVRAAHDAGADGLVLGMSIYTGAIDVDALLEEFGR
ncbi:MAG: HisA/HisF-related TIM barrel protein [Gemmatimonadota bacterium]